MANRNNNASQQDDARKIVRPTAVHKLYNWLEDGVANDPDAIFAAKVMDISRGARVIAGIVCEHMTDTTAQADDPDNGPTLLSASDTEALTRLMVISLRHLSDIADARVEHFNSKAEKGARA